MRKTTQKQEMVFQYNFDFCPMQHTFKRIVEINSFLGNSMHVISDA